MKFLVVIYISTRHRTRKSFTRNYVGRYAINSLIHILSCTVSFGTHAICFEWDQVSNSYFFIRKIKALHLYDCLRANKSTSAWGIEARVPFLDKEFINIAMSIDPEWKLVNHWTFAIIHFTTSQITSQS